MDTKIINSDSPVRGGGGGAVKNEQTQTEEGGGPSMCVCSLF